MLIGLRANSVSRGPIRGILVCGLMFFAMSLCSVRCALVGPVLVLSARCSEC